MHKREDIIKILKKASEIDSHRELFASKEHQYILNPPIEASAIRIVEEKYGFALPEDYFRFITEIGDGGAGPDYGIYPFTDFLKTGQDDYAEKHLERYRRSVAKPFMIRQMTVGEIDNSDFSNEAYERQPGNFFIFEEYCEDDDENPVFMNGFFVIGTPGCVGDFGIITAGERRGQVFETDNGGAYIFLANSFNEFYQRWLDRISDAEALKAELEARRRSFSKKTVATATSTVISEMEERKPND